MKNAKQNVGSIRQGIKCIDDIYRMPVKKDKNSTIVLKCALFGMLAGTQVEMINIGEK